MKHVVELKYTNPSHEHVSLRRRVETVNRVVEAQSADEALNRAANQQRALGFRIQSANIIEQKKKSEPVVEQLNEADRELNVMRAVTKHIGAKDVDQDKRDAGYKMSPAVRAAQKKSDELSKVVKRPQAGTLAAAKMKKEEVESVDEAQKKLKPSYWKAEWRLGTQSEVDKNNKKIYDRLSKTDPDKAKAFHDNLMRMKKKDVKEEVEQIDELNQKTLKSYINKSIETGRANDAEGDHNLYRATSKVARNLATPTLKNKVSKLKYTPMTKHKNPYEYQVSRDELANRKVSEEVEQIDELKKSTLASYVKRATRDVASASRLQRGYETDAARSEFAPVQRGSELAAKNMRKFAGKRSRGIAKAVDKLAKEEVEQIEEGKADKSLAAKAQKSGISLGTLKSVFRRGVAAWNSGHRPGTTPSQWGHARVNSYINKGKTYHTADKDLREEKAKGKDPETSTEVELAKKHGDPKKITYGDVIKARIEASKKKALNKGE